MENFYIIENRQQKGPYNLEELINLNLPYNTLVWKKGLKKWIELKNLPEYKTNVPPPIPSKILKKSQKKVLKENLITDLNHENLNSTLETSSENTHYADFFLRLIAFILDFILLFLITSIIWVFFHLPIPEKNIIFSSEKFILFKNPLAIIVVWLYYSFFENSKFQATPGKAIIGLCVTDIYFRKISFLKATGRYFGKAISGLILGIGFLMIGFTKNKQGLHDKLANTYILKNNSSKRNKKISLFIYLFSIILFFTSLLYTTLIKQTSSNNPSTKWDKYIVSTVSDNLSVSYAGVNFNYPSNWVIKKSELEQDILYQIVCEKTKEDASDVFVIRIVNLELDKRKMIEMTYEGMKEQPSHKYIDTKPIEYSFFKKNIAVSSDFQTYLMGETFYGRISSFNLNGKTLIIIKQSDEITKLISEFKTIENTISFSF